MTRRVYLPLAPARAPAPPQVHAVRLRLGGRVAETDGSAGAGDIVQLSGSNAAQLGVILYASGSVADVYLDAGRVRRTPREDLVPYAGPVPEALSAVAADARSFSAMTEGQRVEFLDNTASLQEGVLLEKCRYGALVLSQSDTLMGVGFRKLSSPARTEHERT